jgi:hypothetical protein
MVLACSLSIMGKSSPNFHRKDDDVANEQQPGKQLSAKGAARRRFTRAGAAASGVLMTLHSQPGMAAIVCATPSGHASALVSARNPDATSCSGASPGAWYESTQPRGKQGNIPGHLKWPVSKNTTFGSVFTTGMEIGGMTFVDVLGNIKPAADPDNLGAHLTAAYLNVMAGLSTFQNEGMLTNIWHELTAFGVYHPTAGVDWNARDVVEYLKSTML